MSDNIGKIWVFIKKTAVLIAVLYALFIGWCLLYFALADDTGVFMGLSLKENIFFWAATAAAAVGYIALAVKLYKA